MLNPRLKEYLLKMITPFHLEDCTYIYAEHPRDVEWGSYTDSSVHAVLLHTPEDKDLSPWMEEIWRVMKPGAHILLVSPESQPTGHSGAIALEDQGFEIRDAILDIHVPKGFHYVSKPSKGERHAGTEHLARKRDPRTLYLKDTLDEEGIAEAQQLLLDAGVDESVVDNAEYQGVPSEKVPKSARKFFQRGKADKMNGNLHPTLKPKELMARLMEDIPTDEGPILDPFMGSGSAALSALKTGHSYIGIEKEAEYLEIADARVRHWDRAESAWVGATIISDYTPPAEETSSLSLLDLLEL